MVIDCAESQHARGSILREPNLYDKYQTFPRRPPSPSPQLLSGELSIAGSRGGDQAASGSRCLSIQLVIGCQEDLLL